MARFQVGRRKPSTFKSTLLLLCLLILLAFLANVTWQLYTRYRFTKTERIKAELTLHQLIQKKELLANLVATLETEAGVEQAVRDKFAVVKPGEFVVNIVDKITATDSATTTVTKKSWWQGWWGD